VNVVLKYIVTMLLLNSGVACSQSKVNNQNSMNTNVNEVEEKRILELIRQFTQYMIDANTDEMEKVVDKNFILTHITGYVQTKAEWFAEIERESMKYYSYKEVKTVVNIVENKATFLGQNLLDARIWGSRNTWRLQQIMKLEKRNGSWIILNSVASIF
jgi:hypothetical protein